MTVTISYAAILLTILTVCVVVAMVYLVFVLTHIQRVASQLETVTGKADILLDSLKNLSDEATSTVVAARILIGEGQQIAADVAAISARVRVGVESVGHVPSLIDRFRAAMAIVAGIRTAISTVRNFLEHRRQTAGESDHEK